MFINHDCWGNVSRHIVILSDTTVVPVSLGSSHNGKCVFSAAAPSLWNKLSVDIRNAPALEEFQSVLKSQLFSLIQLQSHI